MSQDIVEGAGAERSHLVDLTKPLESNLEAPRISTSRSHSGTFGLRNRFVFLDDNPLSPRYGLRTCGRVTYWWNYSSPRPSWETNVPFIIFNSKSHVLSRNLQSSFARNHSCRSARGTHWWTFPSPRPPWIRMSRSGTSLEPWRKACSANFCRGSSRSPSFSWWAPTYHSRRCDGSMPKRWTKC